MLRTSLVWSLITRTPFRMVNVRAGRRDPGLKAQHVAVLKALRLFGGVSFTGAAVGSAVVEFHPAELAGAEGAVEIGTAGSITLLLQTLLPVALHAAGPSRLRLVGGTDVAWSPPLDYLREVVLPPLRERSSVLRITEGRRGFYPKGGGEVILEADRWMPQAPPIRAVERGRLVGLRVLSLAADALAERRVGERQAEAARDELRGQPRECRMETTYSRSMSLGSVATCVAEFEDGVRLGGSALGERGKPAEEVGREAARALVREIDSGAAVDVFAADQLIITLALTGGEFRTREVTEHTRTNVEITEAFLGKRFEIEGTTIRCRARL